MFAPWATNDHNVYRVTGDVQNTGMDAAVQSWCAGCSFSSFQSFLLVLSLQLFIYPIHGKFIDTINELQYMDPLIVLYFQQTHFLNNRHISSLNMELHPSYKHGGTLSLSHQHIISFHVSPLWSKFASSYPEAMA